MQPFAFTPGTGTTCSVHNTSVYVNENTKWVRAEPVKGCCSVRVYLDWINIFFSSFQEEESHFNNIKAKGQHLQCFPNSESQSVLLLSQLGVCLAVFYLFIHLFFMCFLVWFCWLGEALLTTHLLCLCHQLSWLTSAPITCSIKAWSSRCSLPACCWSLVVMLCVVLEHSICVFVLCFLVSASLSTSSW